VYKHTADVTVYVYNATENRTHKDVYKTTFIANHFHFQVQYNKI